MTGGGHTLAQAVGWVGFSVDDVYGKHVGRITGPLVDVGGHEVRWLLVELRRDHHVAIPTTGLVAGAGRLMIPWTRAEVGRVPEVRDAAMTAAQEREAARLFHVALPWGVANEAFPRKRTAELAMAPVAHPAPPVPARPLVPVVIADDHEGVVELLAIAFGAQPRLDVVARAYDGGQALAAIREHRPAVAVVDVRMPVMTGIEVAAATEAEGLPTRVLLLSGDASARDEVLETSGTRGLFLAKGVPPETVAGVVLRLSAWPARNPG